MTQFNLIGRICRAAAGALCVLAIALPAACTSNDGRPLLLVSAAPIAYPNGATAYTVGISVTVDGWDVAGHDYPPSSSGDYGVYLPPDTSGLAVATVRVYDTEGCLLAEGVSDLIEVAPGMSSGPVTVTLTPATESCNADAGTILADMPPVPANATLTTMNVTRAT